MDAGAIILTILGGGFMAGLGSLLTAWINRRKINADAVQVVTSTTVDFTRSVNAQYEVVEARLEKAEQRAEAAEQRSDQLDRSLRIERRKVRDLEDQVSELRSQLNQLRAQLGIHSEGDHGG